MDTGKRKIKKSVESYAKALAEKVLIKECKNLFINKSKMDIFSKPSHAASN